MPYLQLHSFLVGSLLSKKSNIELIFVHRTELQINLKIFFFLNSSFIDTKKKKKNCKTGNAVFTNVIKLPEGKSKKAKAKKK